MHVLPPEKNPLSYPRDHSRSLVRDGLAFVAGILAVALSVAIPFLILLPMKTLGWGYFYGLIAGGTAIAVYVRICHGRWP